MTGIWNASKEAEQLAKTLEKECQSGEVPLDIRSIRQSLHEEFEPRSIRALEKFRPNISERMIAGCSCVIVRPYSKKPTHQIMYLFGGGYVSGSPKYDLPILASLAEMCPAEIVAPKYSLAPESPFPTALNEVFDVFKSLAKEFKNLTLAGNSAGAGLALALVHRLIAEKELVPKKLCLFSPWLDLTATTAQNNQINTLDPTLGPEYLAIASEAYGNGLDLSDPQISPFFAKLVSEFPPTYISSGTLDVFFPQIEKFVRSIRLNGAQVDLKIRNGLWHVFEYYNEIPESECSLKDASKFIAGKFWDNKLNH